MREYPTAARILRVYGTEGREIEYLQPQLIDLQLGPKNEAPDGVFRSRASWSMEFSQHPSTSIPEVTW